MLIGIEQAQLHRFFSRFGFCLDQHRQSGLSKFWLAFDLVLLRKQPFGGVKLEHGATLSTIATTFQRQFNLHQERSTK
jgi:hypothetical protein